MTLASAVVGLAVDVAWLKVLGLVSVYQAFWFLVAGAVVRSGRNAAFNALTYFAIWLASSFIVPSLAYVVQMDTHNLNQGIEPVIDQRQSMSDSWDEHKQKAFAQFLQKHPKWQDTAPLPETFHWKWYYAMQQRSDELVHATAEQYRQGVHSAYRTMSAGRWLSPPLNLQLGLKNIAGTDRAAFSHYLDQMAQWHRSLREFWYPCYFFDEPFQPSHLE